MSNDQNNKELGLIDILQIMGQWLVSGIKKVVDWGLYLFFFGIKQWKILGGALVLIAILTFVKYQSQSTQYEASMIVRSNAIKSTQMKPFFDNYSNLISNAVLSDSLIEVKSALDSITRSQISSVSTYYCIDENRDGIMDEVDIAGKIKTSDLTLDTLNLCVKVHFEDFEVLEDVKKSLVFYLNNIPYIQQMNKARLMQQNMRKQFILNEIQLLDTMQQKSYGETDVADDMIRRGGVLVDNRRVLYIYRDKVELWKEYEVLDKETNFFPEATTVVEDFVIEQTALNTLSSMMKKNVVYGFILVYVLLFLFIVIRKEKDNYLPKL